MKKTLKAFTLIELIMVMAIMTILMAAIMQLMKPIRATYVDSTLYEAQRTTQSGIVKYITESVRYATDVGIYTPGVVYKEYNTSKRTTKTLTFTGDVEQAVINFKQRTGIKDDKLIRVITIDNKNPYTYGDKQLLGRLLVSRPATTSTGETKSTTLKNAATIGTGDGYARLALGPAYYGSHSFSINVVPDGETKKLDVDLPAVPAKYDPLTGSIIKPGKSAYKVNDHTYENNNAIKVVVSSITEAAIDKTGNTVEKSDIKNASSNPSLTYVATEGYIDCLNAGVNGGVLDSRFMKMTGTGATLKPNGTVTNGEMTYIVYAVSPF